MHLHHTKAYLAAESAERRAMAQRGRVGGDPSESHDLLRRIQHRDPAAWATVLRHLGPAVRAMAGSHRLDQPTRDDVVQETWLRLLTHADGIRDPTRLAAWLRTTARRESLRTIAKARRDVVTDPGLLSEQEAAEAEDVLDEEARAEALAEALESLPERWRHMMLLLLRDPTPSYAQISAEVGMPIGSIGPTRARVIERLRADERFVAAITA